MWLLFGGLWTSQAVVASIRGNVLTPFLTILFFAKKQIRKPERRKEEEQCLKLGQKLTWRIQDATATTYNMTCAPNVTATRATGVGDSRLLAAGAFVVSVAGN
jgi:hypothetical protein